MFELKTNTNLNINKQGFVLTEIIIVTTLLVLIFGGIYLIFHSSTNSDGSKVSDTSSSKNATNSKYSVLAPATVPSKVAECDQALTYSSDGNPSPIKCTNGSLNVLEWNALATLEPKVMSLGYSVTAPEVQSNICSDANAADADSSVGASNAFEESVYQISALYYGWNFTSDPSIVLSNGTC
jgi:hypothetical protein